MQQHALSPVLSDANRLAAVRRTRRADSQAAAGFDRTTRLTADVLGTKQACLVAVGEDRQYFLSSHGLPEPLASKKEAGMEYGLGPEVVTSARPLLVDDVDALDDPRQVAALREAGATAYAAVPLTEDGQAVGALFVVDDRPRRWTERDLRVLEALAAAVGTDLDLRREVQARRTAGKELELREAERSLVAAELQESQERYRRLIDLSPDTIAVHVAGKVEYMNPAGLRAVGVDSLDAVIGRSILEFVHPEDRDLVERRVREMLETEQDAPLVELRFQRADGTAVYGEAASTRVIFGGRPGIQVVIRDTTQRRLAEQETRLAEQRAQETAARMRAVAEAAAGVVSVRSHEELQNVVRPACVRVMDFDAFMLALYLPETHELKYLESVDDGIVEAESVRPVAGGPSEIAIIERRSLVTRRSEDWAGSRTVLVGTGRPSQSTIRTPILTDTEVLGVLSLHSYTPDLYSAEDVEVLEALAALVAVALQRIRSIEEREIAMGALQQSEAHYRRLVETSPYGIFVVDEEGRLVEVNAAAAGIMGRRPDDVLGRHFSDFLKGEHLILAADTLQKILGGQQDGVELELELEWPNGELRLVELRTRPIRERGAVVGVHGISRDITEEREAERQRLLLATTLENMGQAVIVYDADGQAVFANGAAAELLGFPTDRLPADSELIPDESGRRQVKEVGEALRVHSSWRGRIRRRRSDDGRVIPLDAMIGRVETPQGPLFLTVLADATESIAQERQLRRVERLASLGTLIGGVAHELNNPLHSIAGFAELLLMDERSEEDVEALHLLRREAKRAAKVVADLRLVARQTQEDRDPEREPVDVNEVVRHVVTLRSYADSDQVVRVAHDLAASLPSVRANRAELEQVLLNLVLNAEQALSAARVDGARVTVRTRPSPRGCVIHVIDNGPGIPSAHLDRIFDPFFTTKAPGEGTGLGLSLAHSIVIEHGGELRVESEPGRGAEFVIDLPGEPEAAAISRPEPAPAPEPASPLHILVVDDEEAVRNAVCRFLRRRGHTVDEAPDGGEALRIIEERSDGEDLDVIVTDLRMPGLSGEALLERLRRDAPELAKRLIFMTGDAASERAGRTLATAGVPVLVKPFGLDQVAAVVEDLARVSGDR